MLSFSNIPTEVMIAALLATLLISLAPNVLLFLFPNYAQNAGKGAALSIGQALAAGGLLGDVFLHTLPHSMMEPHGGHGTVGQMVLVGFTTFLVFDLLVRSVHGGHDHGGHSHDHSHEHATTNGTEKKTNDDEPTTTIFNSTVILNLAADALHNFTDGLAIGASFAAAGTSTTTNASALSLLQSRGGLASLSVLLHELPHELGDFAILVANGMSKPQAIRAQFSTAIAAFAGTFVGLAASTSIGEDVLIPFTAGGFVYLAAVSILPELLQEHAGVLLRILQVVAFGIGIAFMQLVAVLEEMEGGGHGHSHGHYDQNHRGLHHDHEHVHHDHHDHGHHDHEL